MAVDADRARKTFTPSRRTTTASHAVCLKSMVYSKNRILLSDEARRLRPDGERNIQNRGKSKFVRISWDEATDLIARRSSAPRPSGLGAVCVANGSHHQWGNLGHYEPASTASGT